MTGFITPVSFSSFWIGWPQEVQKMKPGLRVPQYVIRWVYDGFHAGPSLAVFCDITHHSGPVGFGRSRSAVSCDQF
jgi:hypothetical protein